MMLNTKKASEYLSLNKNTLEVWRIRGGGPAFHKLGRAVRYEIKDLEEFVKKARRNSTSDGA